MSEERTTVRYSKLPSQGVIYGIDEAGFTTLVICALIAGAAVAGRGLIGLVIVAPVLVPLAVLAVGKLHGQSFIVHILREVIGMARTLSGGTKYTQPRTQNLTPDAVPHVSTGAKGGAKRMKPTPVSVVDLPGQPGRLHLYAAPSGVVVWDAADRTATITCLVATPGMGTPQIGVPQTVSDEHREGMIWEWAKVLGSFTQKPHIVGISQIEHTRPGTAAHERRDFNQSHTPKAAPTPAADSSLTPAADAPPAHWQTNTAAVADAGDPAVASYREALTLADAEVVMHVTQLSITFTLTAEARALSKSHGGGPGGLIAFAEMEMHTIAEALAGAGFTRARWMNAREWGAWARAIIDPASQAAIDTRIGTEWQGVDPVQSTPMLVDDRRTHVETDSAFHRCYWVKEWPRYDTYPGFISRLVFAKQHGARPARHTFALLGAPMPQGKAMKKIEDDKRTWNANAKLRQKTGKPDSAADEAEWHDIVQHERDVVAGQGELRFSAYIVVTALSREALEQESASILNACAATGLEPRMVPWQQWEVLANVAYPTGRGVSK